MNYKCVACLAEGKIAGNIANGHSGAVALPPVANDAITLAPSWQMQQMGPQQLWACVAVPTCGDHLQVKKVSTLEAGLGGLPPLGRTIPGRAER